MRFNAGDLVQIVNERSPYHGSVGTVVSCCDCMVALLFGLLTGESRYCVALTSQQCFNENDLRKIQTRPKTIKCSAETA